MSSSAPARCAWFHCFAGTAGDMTMAALIDAGADAAFVVDALHALDLDGWAVTFQSVTRSSLRATQALVVTDAQLHDHDHDHGHGHHHDHDHDHGHGHGHDHHHDHHHHHDHGHRPYREIRQLLDRAELPHRLKDRAQRTFRLLAEVEGQMHGVDPDEVELHEVGSVDAIVDIVGACAALESLNVERIVCSPISVGMGTVRAAHGRIPHPAPAVAEMLARRNVPTIGLDVSMETATPTGVALMCALADTFGALPTMDVTAAGYGAGTADPPGRPNLVQVIVGTETAASHATPRPGDHAASLAIAEVNVDDATGEEVAHAIAQLLADGANDAWATAIVMKKGRPAHTVHVLAPVEQIEEFGTRLAHLTGSLGWRWSPVHRHAQDRRVETVAVDGHEVRVKRGHDRVKAEFEDAARVAAATGRTVREVIRAAEQAASPNPGRPT